jgi:ParB/RepB/Spo0J family partition protein
MTRRQSKLRAADPPPSPRGAPPASAPEPETRTMVPIAAIDRNTWNTRPRNPKGTDPEDQSLTESIRQHGVLENLLVRPRPGGRFELIFGERRLRCAKAAGRLEVPTSIRELDDHEARVLTVTENLHRKQLHFFDEALGVAALFEEDLSAEKIAGKLNKPLSWVARRKRLLNLTPEWRELALSQNGWTARWRDQHFEQLAKLEPLAQADLLTRSRWELERCETVRDLARLIASRTRDLAGFPWPLDDADLDPTAGACSNCPFRSSRHPGLFDDQEAEPPAGATRKPRRRKAGADHPDRCLNPLCADNKARLFVERKRAALAARHPNVVLLQSGHVDKPIPGTLRDHQVQLAKKGTPGAVPAVIASGSQMGEVRWVKPRAETRPTSARTQAPGERKPLAEREQQRWRQRKVKAIDLLKPALLEQPPPLLDTIVRLAVVFGTEQTYASSARTFDLSLPRVGPGTDAAQESRRMLARHARAAAGASATDATGPDLPPELPDPMLQPQTAADPPQHQEGPCWHTFDALEGDSAASTTYLWARTLGVLLDRMTPNGDWRHVDTAWREAERTASIAGLKAQDFLDRATAALPDPKSWTKERQAASAAAPAPAAAAAADAPPAPVKITDRTSRRTPKLRPVAAPRHRVASRLPR